MASLFFSLEQIVLHNLNKRLILIAVFDGRKRGFKMKYVIASEKDFRGFSSREAAMNYFLKLVKNGYKPFLCQPGRICNASKDGNIIWMQKLA